MESGGLEGREWRVEDVRVVNGGLEDWRVENGGWRIGEW